MTERGEVTRERKALDLFCKAGGASMGLYQAGFDVTGVDIEPQSNYPFRFEQADAMSFPLATCEFIGGSQDHYPEICDRCGKPWKHADHRSYDFIWASPPCQAHTRLNGINGNQYRDYIPQLRERLDQSGIPYVIENVMGAPLKSPAILCGSMFGLRVWRHRLIEHSFPLAALTCRHSEFPNPIDVTGTGGPCSKRTTPGGGFHNKPKNLDEAQAAMGIDWMTRKELSQAIPPAYSKYIGEFAMKHLEASR
jgi:DNA (cytosine-5)-methyltransferase 1